MSSLYLDAYDAAVLRHWAELLSRHHASLRRPYATGRITVREDDDGDGAEPPELEKARPAGEPGGHGV